MTHAFISYVRENSDIVDRLSSELMKHGITVWLDRSDIKPGRRWKDAINEAIQEGAFFIACYSKELNEKQETYMHGEISIAVDRLRTMPRNRAWFIPVCLNETKIPSHYISDYENLKDFQAIELYKDWTLGIRKLLQTLKK